jgi:hypothetical protein
MVFFIRPDRCVGGKNCRCSRLFLFDLLNRRSGLDTLGLSFSSLTGRRGVRKMKRPREPRIF